MKDISEEELIEAYKKKKYHSDGEIGVRAALLVLFADNNLSKNDVISFYKDTDYHYEDLIFALIQARDQIRGLKKHVKNLERKVQK